MFVQIKSSFLILLALFFSVFAYAEDRKGHKFNTVREYHQHDFEYNTTKPCVQPFCVNKNLTVYCHKYSYVQGNSPGNKIQFCHISEIVGDTTLKVPEALEYTMATGYYDSKNNFHTELPPNEFLHRELNETIPDPMGTEAGVTQCEGLECGIKKLVDIISSANPNFTPIIQKNEALGRLLASQIKTQKLAAFCYPFVKPDGELGDYGNQALSSMRKAGWSCFSGESSPAIDVSDVCPNFKKFDDTTKEFFWVWVFASMANKESSCKTQARVKGTLVNGHQEYAVGLMQMEESYLRRRSRGPECSTKRGQTVFDVAFQFDCTASILRDINCNGISKPTLTYSRGYWQELRGKHGEISNNIKKFPGCSGPYPSR